MTKTKFRRNIRSPRSRSKKNRSRKNRNSRRLRGGAECDKTIIEHNSKILRQYKNLKYNDTITEEEYNKQLDDLDKLLSCVENVEYPPKSIKELIISPARVVLNYVNIDMDDHAMLI